jgi:hypothetical protein
MWRAAGGGGNYTGYQLVVRDVPFSKCIFQEKYSVIIIVVF